MTDAEEGFIPKVSELAEWRQVALSKWIHYRDNVHESGNDIAGRHWEYSLAKLVPHLIGRSDLALSETPTCGQTRHGFACVEPYGHNRGQADVPENHTPETPVTDALEAENDQGPTNARAYTPDERWERRYEMSQPELIDAAGQLLDMAGHVWSSTPGTQYAAPLAPLWLARAQWYMLRLEGKNRAFREGLINSLAEKGQSPTGRLVYDTNPPSYGGPAFQKGFDSVMGPGQFSQMYPAGPIVEKKEPLPLPREYCDDETQHSAHTWPEENDKLCLGRGEGGIRLRPIRDNPQA